MIEKMKFISITGIKDDIDRVIEKYLSHYDIHYENALSELKYTKNLRAFTDADSYKDAYDKLCELLSDEKDEKDIISRDIALSEAAAIADDISDQISTLKKSRSDLGEKRKHITDSMSDISQFVGLDYDISQILSFRFLKYRFGRFKKEYYNNFISYAYDNTDSVFLKCHENDDYIWGVYFTPSSSSPNTDAIYGSMNFERIYMPDGYDGTPSDATKDLIDKAKVIDYEIDNIDQEISEIIHSSKADLISAYKRLSDYERYIDIRKFAACVDNHDSISYILCGWMQDKDARKLQKEIDSDSDIFLVIEDDPQGLTKPAPTKLKNNPLVKPFEMYTEMYGLPAYGEIDPTTLVAITYSIFFGFMFGDLGQGLVLMIVGLLLYRAKGIRLAGIISRCGFSSAIFGLLFGSFFGFEDVIKAYWLRPSEAMSKLKIIGNLNTVFVISILLGMATILVMMILNIYIKLKNHDKGNALFDTNGLAGFVFYGILVATIISVMTGHHAPARILLILMFVLPLAIILLKEPLSSAIEGHGFHIKGGIGMFFVQGFFELFEVLLSYFSNTLSFVRIGAFAVSHAAMMGVVLMLSGETSGHTNWAVVVLGNLFVCGMEGLIVGIQVLRLEYYELFSRFYGGTGRAFVPFNNKNK